MGQRKSDRIIRIRTVEQLNGTLLPANEATYELENFFDPTFSITIPDGGLSFSASSFDTGGFSCTQDNHSLFTGTFSGNVIMKNMKLAHSGTNSRVFNNTGDGGNSLEFTAVNFGDFDDAVTTTSLGNLTDMRQLFFDGCGLARVSDGFTLDGPYSGILFSKTIVARCPSGFTLFKSGASFSLSGSSTADANFGGFLNDAGITIYDFDETQIVNDGQFVLDGARFGSLTDPLPNIDETSTKVFFRDCVGIRNTKPGFDMEFTTQVTTPLTEDTPVKALGTTTTSRNTWWTQTANNEMTYDSSLVKDFKITVNITVDGGANDEIGMAVRKWDDSASAYVILKEKVRNISNIIGGLDVTTFSFSAVGEFAENDRIEIWIENQDDNTNATVLSGSEIFVEVI